MSETPEVKSATKTGRPMKKRIANVKVARAVVDDLNSTVDKVPVFKQRAYLKGMYDGNPPFSKSALERSGQGHRTNVNFRELRGEINQHTAAAFELHMDTEVLVKFKVADRKAVSDPEGGSVPDWLEIIAEEYTETLRAWPGFFLHGDQVTRDAALFGIGAMVWTDPFDWRPTAIPISALRFPMRGKVLTEAINLFRAADTMPMWKLFEVAEDDTGMAEKAGWSQEAVRRYLGAKYADKAVSQDRRMDTLGAYEAIQEARKMGDPALESEQFSDVDIYHLFVSESDGKVSHYILGVDQLPDNDAFLFKNESRYNKMAEVLWLLPFRYEDGYIYSIRGLGHDSAPHCDLSNRYLCGLFDGGFMAAGVIAKPASRIDVSRLQLIRMGGLTILPPDIELQQNATFTPQMQSLILLRSLSSAIHQNNVGIVRAKSEEPMQVEQQKTARQVMYEEGKEARFEKSEAAFYYLHWDWWHQEVYRRLLAAAKRTTDQFGTPEAKAFVQRCVDRGVPRAVLTEGKLKIFCARAIGLGSPSVAMDITNQLVSIAGELDEAGREEAVREWVIRRVGVANADRFKPRRNRNAIPSTEHGFATLENNDFVEGAQIPVGANQIHVVHLSVHLSPLVEAVGVYEQQPEGVDLMKLGTTLQLALPHCASHLQYLGRSRIHIKEYKEYLGLMKKLAVAGKAIYDELMRRQEEAQRQAQDAAAAQQGMPSEEAQVELRKIELKAELERVKQDSLNQVREEKTQALLEMKRANMAVQAALAAETAAVQNRLRALETAAKLEQQGSTAQAGEARNIASEQEARASQARGQQESLLMAGEVEPGDMG